MEERELKPFTVQVEQYYSLNAVRLKIEATDYETAMQLGEVLAGRMPATSQWSSKHEREEEASWYVADVVESNTANVNSKTECYHCEKEAVELSPRSRCVHCEYKRAKFNEEENDTLRDQLAYAEQKARRLGVSICTLEK